MPVLQSFLLHPGTQFIRRKQSGIKLSGILDFIQTKLFQRWKNPKPVSGISGRPLLLFVASLLLPVVISSSVNAETRKLKLYYLHTGEKATIAFKKNGSYIPRGLKKINIFLRDWRHNEPTKMDPNLLDLIWEVYQKSGSRDYIHIISGYRSPATNNMLRKRGRGVAKKSQHTLGKALDFFLPDVKLAKLRKIGLIKQVGGVGYYPTSGSPFVHMDTGNVRHWPRMTRKQLVKVFPNGKTLHVPTDGKPLPGYNQAVAAFNNKKSSRKKIAQATGTKKERKNFFQRLAALRHSDDDEDRSPNFAPAPRRVSTKSRPVVTNPLTTTPSTAVRTPTETPVPEPQAPQIPSELPLLASIPVPRAAPRNVNRDLALQQTPDIGNTQQVNDNALTFAQNSNNPDLNDQTLEGQFETATLNIPIPSARPEHSFVQLAQAEVPLPVATPTNIDTQRINNEENSALSTSGGHELRNQLIAQAQNQLRQKINRTIAARRSSVPRPSLNVGENFQIAALTPQENTSVQQRPLTRSFSRIEPATKNVVENVAANPLPKPIEKPEISTSSDQINLATPTPRPKLFEDQPASNPTLVTAFTSDDLAKEPDIRDTAPLILAAIPTPSPRQHINRIEENPVVIAPPLNKSAKPVRRQSANSLNTLSVAWLDKNRTGKFALSNSVTNETADAMRAPAYGQAAIRQSPDRVLTAGFTPFAQVQVSSRFTGNAVQFQSFTLFN